MRPPAEPMRSLRSGGQILIDALQIHGVDCLFTVPGESFLPALDALHDARERIRMVVCRQEGAAAHMAEAYGKLTGKPGLCFVTRAPGATNASIGVHTAAQDSTPMILLVGQVRTGVLGREAWQEIDLAQMFRPVAKWATQIDEVARIPEIINRAFHTAVSGRPGPVVVAIPEDILYAQAEVADVGRYQNVQAHPGTDDMARLQQMLNAAQRPLLILGGGGWDQPACADMQRFVENFDVPVGTGFRRQDLLDNRDPHYAGDIGIGINPALAQRVRDADLVIAVGSRLGETTTSDYQLLGVPRPAQKLIHVHADSRELGRVYQADLMIHAGMCEFAQSLALLPPPKAIGWHDWTNAANKDYQAYLQPGAMPGTLDLGAVMVWLREHLPADAIITNGAGNYTSWVHRFYRYTGFRTQLAPASGVMGYGVPAAISAKLVHPECTVVCFAGDGCFLMNSQELATVKQNRLPIVFLVINNAMYGSIRMHQERHYPGKVYGTDLDNPDFAALAESYGLDGQMVERTEDFPAAFERAVACGKGALIELRVSSRALTPRMSLPEKDVGKRQAVSGA